MKYLVLTAMITISAGHADYIRDAADYYHIDYKKLKSRVEKTSGILKNDMVLVYPWTVHINNKSYQFKDKVSLLKYVLKNKHKKDLAIGVLPITVSGLSDSEIIQLIDPEIGLMTALLIEQSKKQKSLAPKNLDQLINSVALSHGLSPKLIHAVVRQESNYKPSIVSHAGAVGLMQLMPATAKDLGLSQNELTNPYKNVDAGTRYLKQQLQTFKRLDLALAAYNAGPGAVKKYNGIPPYKETQNYVTTILKNLGVNHG